jgi:trehalose 6-phosphate synthase/phosphatase
MVKSKTERIDKGATRKLVLLDYDGTLVDFVPQTDLATPSQHLLDVLARLTDSQTNVFIVTGRKQHEMDVFFAQLPIDIVAEHGAAIRVKGKWRDAVQLEAPWKKEIIPILRETVRECAASWIEEKPISLAWHYRNSPADQGNVHAQKLIQTLEKSAELHGLRILDGNKVVEIIPKHVSKGNAVRELLDQAHYDSIVCIGDDKTDEDMFQVLLQHPKALTFKVGEGQTLAKYTLASVQEVISLLETLCL